MNYKPSVSLMTHNAFVVKQGIIMTQQEDKKDSVFPDEKNTTIVAETRRTGQGARQSDAKEGAKPEAPGDKNTDVPGDPNQGTEAR